MTILDNGGPAFPLPGGEFLGEDRTTGMSLRDYFAAKAYIPDEILSSALDTSATETEAPPKLARWCYAWADAMLAERAKPAAAPVLLDALKDALLTLEAIKENWGDEHPGLDKTLAEEIDRTRAAVAKAEGR